MHGDYIARRMKLYLESYGCTLQKAESSMYVNRMLSEGNELVKSPQEADLSLIGTCVVIKRTEDRMIRRIQELSEHSKVKVLGCLTSVGGDAISGSGIEVVDPSEFRNMYGGSLDGVEVKEPSIWEGIPINQGCTGSCNFCISRVARGKLVSRPPNKVVDQIRMQLDRGVREVRITSLDTAAYGMDINTSLPELVNGILNIEENFRLRIGMMEPKNTTAIADRLFGSMKDQRVFRFLHLPVQSGDNRVLEQMNREYVAETFENIAERYRNAFLDGTLSTDIVVGYHCDDEESFEKTYSLMERVKPDIMNITKFSPRPYTKDFEKRVPASNLVKKWSSALTELHHRILDEKLSSMIGRTFDAMSSEEGKNNSTVLRDSNYRPVVVMDRIPVYENCKVEIVDRASTFMIGKIIG